MDIITKESLLNIEWFSNCGRGQEFSFYNVQVSSLQKALRFARKMSWENAVLEFSEDAREEIRNKDHPEYRLWNNLAKEYRQFLAGELRPKWSSFIDANGLSKEFVDSVNWDLIHILILNNYRDRISDMSFFDNLYAIYSSGKFPCGYKKKIFSSKGYFLVY